MQQVVNNHISPILLTSALLSSIANFSEISENHRCQMKLDHTLIVLLRMCHLILIVNTLQQVANRIVIIVLG